MLLLAGESGTGGGEQRTQAILFSKRLIVLVLQLEKIVVAPGDEFFVAFPGGLIAADGLKQLVFLGFDLGGEGAGLIALCREFGEAPGLFREPGELGFTNSGGGVGAAGGCRPGDKASERGGVMNTAKRRIGMLTIIEAVPVSTLLVSAGPSRRKKPGWPAGCIFPGLGGFTRS